MGRKGKKGGNKSSPQNMGGNSEESPALSKAAKKEVADLVNQLLDICAKPPVSGAKEWEDYPEIHALVEKIRKIQSALTPTIGNREDGFTKFLQWLQDNGVNTETVEITYYPECGYGLKAKKDMKEAEHILSIPRKIMLTVDSAKKSPLGALITEDKILQTMANITLALHLLCEKKTKDSFWKPYIDILPFSYMTPLYFSSDDLQQLKGSPALGDSLSQYRNIARQYAYFYRILQKSPTANSLPIRDFFTYDEYRWAVSSVMTRQNQIPTKDGSQATFGLIPLWDMCNHSNGHFTTDFSVQKDCSECFSLKEFKCGDQIFIFYGARSNAEFLVHNGFVYPDNEHDRLCLKLGISKGDNLYDIKVGLLGKIGLPPSRAFFLHRGDNPVDGDLLAFLRVFSMEEDQLKDLSGEETTNQQLEKLKDAEFSVSSENEKKVWDFLEMRAGLLLKAYPTSVEADHEELKQSGLSESHTLALQLRICEKQILKTTVEYAALEKQNIHQPSGS